MIHFIISNVIEPSHLTGADKMKDRIARLEEELETIRLMSNQQYSALQEK